LYIFFLFHLCESAFWQLTCCFYNMCIWQFRHPSTRGCQSSKKSSKSMDIVVVYKCELYVPHRIKKVKVEHLIRKRTHKPIALRFWVRVWRLSCLCGCSNLDVEGPPELPSWLDVDTSPIWDPNIGSSHCGVYLDNPVGFMPP